MKVKTLEKENKDHTVILDNLTHQEREHIVQRLTEIVMELDNLRVIVNGGNRQIT